MEKRKIIVVSSATQSQVAFESDATTLGELKKELDSRNVSYSGMTFLEGHSKLEMNLDEAVLPTNIPYKGGVTNDLVFLLTSPQKKIKSGGVDRIDIYTIIRDNHLAEKIKEHFGKNFTNISTESLIKFLESLKDDTDERGEEEQKKRSCCDDHYTSSSSLEDYDDEDEDDDEDDEEEDNDCSETSAADNMIDGLKHIIYGMVKLGYINPVEITKPDEHTIISKDGLDELFGRFFD